MAKQEKPWRLTWEIDSTLIDSVKDFYSKHENNTFVKIREKRNIKKQGLNLTKEFLWEKIIVCLLTSQQKSGPNSRVSIFCSTKPFPLGLKFCLENLSILEIEAEKILKNFGGLRRSTIIAEHLKENLQNLVTGDWKILTNINTENNLKTEKETELFLVQNVQQQIKGFGPKQSRNFLQILGLTKYEIPLDSRISDWLNKFNFPIKITSAGLSDPYFYQFISEGIQDLCEKAEIYPCLLDAAIFSSYDKDEWNEENSVF
jgi:hypothetical protein